MGHQQPTIPIEMDTITVLGIVTNKLNANTQEI